MEDNETKILRESNAVEGVYDEYSLRQALVAWEFLTEQKVLTMGVVLKVHKILMLNQPLQPDEKGYLRHIPVYIGAKEALSWKLVPLKMAEWVKDMNESFSFPRFGSMSDSGRQACARDLHVQYERIHPFVDGNGRTGRMFMNWHRKRMGLPLLLIKEADKHIYYKWFK